MSPERQSIEDAGPIEDAGRIDVAGPIESVDAIGRRVWLSRPARRVVSLVPSTTETLAALGVGACVVGRTRFCVHPRPWIDGIAVVGGTKDPDLPAIAALHPDLILGNEEENLPRLWSELEAIAPLCVGFPRDPDGALVDLQRTARLVAADEAGARLVADIEQPLAAIRARPWPAHRFAYMVWRGPWMAAGGDAYVSALLSEFGGCNVFGTSGYGPARYPKVSIEELVAAQPDVVWLSSEPYAFTPRHVAELGPLAEQARMIDGELASWHGVRMAAALPYLRDLIEGL